MNKPRETPPSSFLTLISLQEKEPMNRSLKLFTLLLGSAFMCSLGFWLGKRQDDKAAFERGANLEKERAALFRGANSEFFVKLIDAGETKQLRSNLENGMWISIVPMDSLLRNPDASDVDRRQVNHVLPRLVEYYHRNPKVVEKPESIRISDDVVQSLDAEKHAKGVGGTEKEVLEDLGSVSKKPMEQLDRMFNGVFDEVHKFDLETQEVLMRHISQRNFPGRTKTAAGVTFKMPDDSGGGGSSTDEFRYNGKKIRVLYKNGTLRVNDWDFGRVAKGDTVDLRLLGHVFVNDIERRREDRATE